jgi:hypothetical protein
MPCSGTPAGPIPPGFTVDQRGPRNGETEGYPRVRRSRGSIARPERSLSTLRRGHYCPHRKTRFRLPARLYRVGLATHRAPTKGFRDESVTSLPPFPSFLTLRQTANIGVPAGTRPARGGPSDGRSAKRAIPPRLVRGRGERGWFLRTGTITAAATAWWGTYSRGVSGARPSRRRSTCSAAGATSSATPSGEVDGLLAPNPWYEALSPEPARRRQV